MPRIKETLYIYSMGKRFRVGGMFPDTPEGNTEANRFCKKNDEQAVIAVAGGIIFTADKYQAPNDAPEGRDITAQCGNFDGRPHSDAVLFEEAFPGLGAKLDAVAAGIAAAVAVTCGGCGWQGPDDGTPCPTCQNATLLHMTEG